MQYAEPSDYEAMQYAERTAVVEDDTAEVVEGTT